MCNKIFIQQKIVKSFKLDELAKLSRFISTLDSKDERFLYTATLLTESDFCDLINKAIDIVDMFDVLKGI